MKLHLRLQVIDPALKNNRERRYASIGEPRTIKWNRIRAAREEVLDIIAINDPTIVEALEQYLTKWDARTPADQDIKIEEVFDTRGSYVAEVLGKVGLKVTNTVHAGHQRREQGPTISVYLSLPDQAGSKLKTRVPVIRVAVSDRRDLPPYFCVSSHETSSHPEELADAHSNNPCRANKINSRNKGSKDEVLRALVGQEHILNMAILVGNAEDSTEVERLLKKHLPQRPPMRQMRSQSWSVAIQDQSSRNHQGVAKRLDFVSYAPIQAHYALSFHTLENARAAHSSFE
ncbi:hypothetical protein CF319_g7549 [Tilletia indica]|uniref:Uncharacterized protein n=1 Tax=Tilletia indica TaxID=43049 RepID=A0A177TTM7_9BASI|nr:hypothetical protein CF319_g7549 [Tilletia indica]KAE8229366.1 hypothetical protein CF326_g5664 [Tilletia indica]KAE8242537.1 hypothetical protein A4X13_0g7117 [Tilletia indica]